MKNVTFKVSNRNITLHKKLPIKDFVSKCAQIHRKLRIWSHLLKKSLMGNFIFCVVLQQYAKLNVYDVT